MGWLVAVTLVGLLAGCIADGTDYASSSKAETETRKGALTSDSYQAVVAAYFTPEQTSYWDEILAHPPAFVIINGPGSQPPTPGLSDWTGLVARLKSNNVKVLGYIALPYGTSYDTFSHQLGYWDSYDTDGFFFDELNRTSDQHDLNKILWIVRDSQQMWTPAKYTFFNFSGAYAYLQPWIDCASLYSIPVTDDSDSLSRYVMSETTAQTYEASDMDPSSSAYMFEHNTWVQGYEPIQFISIVNQAIGGPSITNADVDTIFSNAASFNTKSVYITDWTGDANTYGGGPPSSALWDYQASKLSQAANFSGTPVSHTPTNCPVPSICDHDLCTANAGPLGSCENAEGCVYTVCQSDDYCCTTQWDDQCVGEGEAWCGAPYDTNCG